MMRTFLSFIKEAVGDTSATTFYHEVICGIACVDPMGAKKIKTGADVKNYFDNGTIIAVDRNLNKLDIMNLKQSRFLSSKEKPKGKLISDAIQIAKKLIEPSRLGKPHGPVYWTGPTNDGSIFGAADIAFNKVGISLKYGEGQLKNLTVGSFGRTVLGIKENILQVLLKDYSASWDQMTRDWMDFVKKTIPLEKGKIEFEALSNTVKSWSEYQKKRLEDDDQEFFDEKDNGYVKTHKKAKEFRFLARKYYETEKPPGWDELRNKSMGSIFDSFIKSKDKVIRKNLADLFKTQISVSKTDLWYAAKGGKDIKLIPSEEKFKRGIENVRFDYTGETKGSGYTFTLIAHTIDKDIEVMKIEIVFRFKNGQMYGNPDTSSTYKMMVDDYTDIFGS